MEEAFHKQQEAEMIARRVEKERAEKERIEERKRKEVLRITEERKKEEDRRRLLENGTGEDHESTNR